MIGHLVKFNNIDFTENGVVENARYTSLSVTPLYFESVGRLPKFRKFEKNIKEVEISYRMFTTKIDYRENEKKAETFISDLFEEEVKILQINYKYCESLFVTADYEVLNNTILFNLKFINLNGFWYGEEKIIQSSEFENNGVRNTNFATIKITPTSEIIKIRDQHGNKIQINAFNTTHPIFIDLQNKTVKQNEVHSEITEDSEFFEIRKGSNNFLIDGGNFEITFREVVAL